MQFITLALASLPLAVMAAPSHLVERSAQKETSSTTITSSSSDDVSPPRLSQPFNAGEICGGFWVGRCVPGYECKTDPTSECALAGGADCEMRCYEAEKPAEQVQRFGPGEICGGFWVGQCVEGFTCKEDPATECATVGGADCDMRCFANEEQQEEQQPEEEKFGPGEICGGFWVGNCVGGFECKVDPASDCALEGGADCDMRCFKTGTFDIE